MSTTGAGFVKLPATPTAVVTSVTAAQADSIASTLGGSRVDKVVVDLGKSGYAKNGAVWTSLSGTTTKTVSLADTTLTASGYAGDTAFSGYFQLVFRNDGAQTVGVAPAAGGSALSLPFSSMNIAASASHVLTLATSVSCPTSACKIDLNPASGGSVVISIGGA